MSLGKRKSHMLCKHLLIKYCEQAYNAKVAITSDDDCISLMSEVSIFLTHREIDRNR